MSCYCISHSHNKDVRSESDEPSSSSMELDAALHELGMLSRITDSRADFLKEKFTTKKKIRSSSSLSTAPLCVVQMNSKFITKFSLSKNSRSDDSEDSSEKTEPPAEENPKRAQSRFKAQSHRYWRRVARDKPYDRVPRKPGFNNPGFDDPVYIPDVAVEERVGSPGISRQDSGGNKSNPSSPAKSQNPLPPTGSSIVRSRSLDDLEIAKVEDSKEDCYCRYGRSDIETVSQRISNLHVS